MRVLALDLGQKRIGLALSDENATFAFPAGVLRSRGRKPDVEAICALIAEKGVGHVVVGLPIHMDGRKGEEAKAAQRFADALAAATRLPVSTLDERLTTVEAERTLRAQGRRGRRLRENVDEVAASIILRTFLDSGRLASTSESAAAATAPEGPGGSRER